MSWTARVQWVLPKAEDLDKNMIAWIVINSVSTLLLVAAAAWRRPCFVRTEYRAAVAVVAVLHYSVWYAFFWLPWTNEGSEPAASQPWAAGELLFVCAGLFLYDKPYLQNSTSLALGCVVLYALAATLALVAGSAAAAWALPPVARALLCVPQVERGCRQLLAKAGSQYAPLAARRPKGWLLGRGPNVLYGSCALGFLGAVLEYETGARALALAATLGLLLSTWFLLLQPGVAGVDVPLAEHKQQKYTDESKQTPATNIHKEIKAHPQFTVTEEDEEEEEEERGP